MPDDAYSFSQTRVRLEEIVTQVRKKDVSLEKSLDLLEEGVRLANQCTELIDHADWAQGTVPTAEGVSAEGETADAKASEAHAASSDVASESEAPADDGRASDSDAAFAQHAD